MIRKHKNKRIYLIDIDGTVCEDIPNEEAHRFSEASVIPGSLEKILRLKDEGNIITFFTARTFEHAEVTEDWLNKNGFPFESVCYGKPRSKDGYVYHWADNMPVESSFCPHGFVEDE